MFIGYLKNGFEESLEDLLIENPLFDLELLKQTYHVYPQHCFAAYEDSKIVGILSAYIFENYLYINVIDVISKYEDILKRLISLLLRNFPEENILVLIENDKSKQLEELGFKTYSDFLRFMHSGESVAFNFSNSTAKQVSGEHYAEVAKRVDRKVFNLNRDEYLKTDCVFTNSLKLSTGYGFLHSYVVNKRFIKISPWIMDNEAFLDAEKLLRGVLYYRGLKSIYGYAPKNVKEIVDLYQSYKFKIYGDFKLMYLNEKPNIILDNLYAI
ncbi:hypothetical protein AVENP_0070 [Arcobacter venerupis]|uniref:Uncharacterized protein n=1 Tax=Arcobacter venerupis TaxID=1054033 RepID=A0AAE7B8G4_9BACT|nr:hypothetical protein [Arcobacter venerupis]QKF65652.1 hypothetical protein AVENP_0070 [Arcobacter venerupis]RWS50164.1 hypothetical protein CKA56_04320 [Arcobacter venerupis]